MYGRRTGGERFEGPHEIHVTVEPPNDLEVRVFEQVCGDLGVKAHSIENLLPSPSGRRINDYLTGSEFHGRTDDAFRELARISAGLHEEGLTVVREKIETIPDHPLAPRSCLDQLGPGQYFECHFTLPDFKTIHDLRINRWGGVPFLISTTDNKRARGELFATMRSYTTDGPRFVADVERVHESLAEQLSEDGYDLKDPTVEFALIDTNPGHDADWIRPYRKLVQPRQ